MKAVAETLADDSTLRSCMLFSELTDEERAVLVARAPTRTFGPGETVFLMGSHGNSMMAVLSGSVRISVSSPDGKELTLAIVQKDEIFGEITLLDRKERTADATAMTACRLAVLERREMLSFLQAHPAAFLRIVDMLCTRLRRTDQHIAELALLPVPVRLAKALLRVAATCDGPVNRWAALPIQLSQRELGTMVGATRESVNKYLRAWQCQRCRSNEEGLHHDRRSKTARGAGGDGARLVQRLPRMQRTSLFSLSFVRPVNAPCAMIPLRDVDTPGATMARANSGDRKAVRLNLVEEHIRFENQHDLAGIMGTFGATARYGR